MGFICEKYSDNRAGLTVVFHGNNNTDSYFAGDSASDALNHFGLYVENNTIYARTDEEVAMEAAGIQNAQEATELRAKIDEITEKYTDEQAIENSMLFPAWAPEKRYVAGYRVRDNGNMYKALQTHVSHADLTPEEDAGKKGDRLWEMLNPSEQHK